MELGFTSSAEMHGCVLWDRGAHPNRPIITRASTCLVLNIGAILITEVT
jgi:hypothetical protein